MTVIEIPGAEEAWLPIDGFPLYEVSNHGRVRSKRYQRWNVPRKNWWMLTPHAEKKWGYWHVGIRDAEHKRCNILIHRIVAIAFIPNPKKKPQVNHKDGNKSNNCANNLEWTSAKENQRHAHQSGLTNPRRAENHPQAKLTNEIVMAIFRERHAGAKLTRVAEKYGVDFRVVSQIARGRIWSSVTQKST